MPRGGKRPGSGSPRGPRGPQRGTIIQREANNIREQAEAAALAAEKARNAGKRLAKDVLEEFMLLFAGMAATHQPLPPGMPVPVNRQPDEAKFEKWARLAGWFASELAPYQSPTFKAVAIMAPPPQPTAAERGTNVIALDDPVALARVYARRVQAVK